jgi:hypothetical protein
MLASCYGSVRTPIFIFEKEKGAWKVLSVIASNGLLIALTVLSAFELGNHSNQNWSSISFSFLQSLHPVLCV